MSEPKILHEWTLAGYCGRIVETEPGIVTSEQAMDDATKGRLWLSNRSPVGWPNEMLQLRFALAAAAEREKVLVEALELACSMGRYNMNEHIDRAETDAVFAALALVKKPKS